MYDTGIGGDVRSLNSSACAVLASGNAPKPYGCNCRCRFTAPAHPLALLCRGPDYQMNHMNRGHLQAIPSYKQVFATTSSPPHSHIVCASSPSSPTPCATRRLLSPAPSVGPRALRVSRLSRGCNAYSAPLVRINSFRCASLSWLATSCAYAVYVAFLDKAAEYSPILSTDSVGAGVRLGGGAATESGIPCRTW